MGGPSLSHPRKTQREPRLTQRNYLIQASLVRRLKGVIHRHLSGKANLLILDCGCGDKPYYPFFEGISRLYVGVDRRRGEYVDVIGDVQQLPFRDDLFDVVVCTQVIEHIPHPQTLVNEIHRVLKCGGLLILSTHGVWPVHAAPNDFWRWTDFGLRRLLEGFSLVRVYECGGNIATFFQIANLYMPSIPHLRPLLSAILNKLGEYLDQKFRGRAAQLIMNYLAVAEK